MAGKKHNLAPMWKKLMKNVDIEDPTSFLDHVNGTAKQKKNLLDNRARCLNPVFLLEQPRNYQDGTTLAQKLQRGPTTWKDMLASALNDIAGWQTKRQSNNTMFLGTTDWSETRERVWMRQQRRPCLDDHQIKKEEWKLKVSCQKFDPILYYKNKCLARIGRPDILWSVHNLARSVTKWTEAFDRRLARLISYIHYTSNYRQYCPVGDAAQLCRLGLCQDSDFEGDLEDSKSTSRGVLCIWGSRTFVPLSWMCKKQSSV